MCKENEYLTNSEADDMIIDIKIRATIKKIENKLGVLEDTLKEERRVLYWYREGVTDYKPNAINIIKHLGSEIDDLCSTLNDLYKAKDIISEKLENNIES